MIELIQNLKRSMKRTGYQNAIYTQAKTLLHYKNFEESLNRTSHLLPIKDSRVVDLKDGRVSPRTKEHLFSFECPVSFDGDLSKATPKADRFFLDMTCEDPKKMFHLQKHLGYCLTGEVNLRDFMIWIGPKGLNGKSRDGGKFLRKNALNFKTSAKLIIQTNNMPQLNGADQAMKDRLKVVEWNARFTKDGEGDGEIQ